MSIGNALEKGLVRWLFASIYLQNLTSYIEAARVGHDSYWSIWDSSWVYTLPNRKYILTSRCVSCMFELPCFCHNFSSHVGKSLEALDQYIQSPKTCLFQFPNLPPPNKQTKKPSLFILGVCRRILFTNGYKMLQHEGKVQILSSTFSPQLSFFSVWRNIIYYEPRHNHWS